MPGSVRDLSVASTRLPPRLIVDSSIIIDWLLTAAALPAAPVRTMAQHRANRFVARLRADRATGLVTAVVLNEVLHFVLKSWFRAEVPNHRIDLGSRFPEVRRPGWEHLYKTRSDLVGRFSSGFDEILRLMVGNRLIVLQPGDLGDVPSGRAIEGELVRAMSRYGFDSNDAAILLDAKRAGVAAVASSDADFRRAQLDFDVYTWL
jgi:hypothetical protein